MFKKQNNEATYPKVSRCAFKFSDVHKKNEIYSPSDANELRSFQPTQRF